LDPRKDNTQLNIYSCELSDEPTRGTAAAIGRQNSLYIRRHLPEEQMANDLNSRRRTHLIFLDWQAMPMFEHPELLPA
jgi:hypothetical protein